MSDQESSPEDPYDDADTIPSGAGGAELSPSALGPAVVALVSRVETVEDRLGDLDARLDKLGKEKKAATAEPAEWVWFPVPALSSHPPATAALWVEFYNDTYVTTTSSTGDDRNRAIPGCWLQHPGLAARVPRPHRRPDRGPELARPVATRIRRPPTRVGSLHQRPPLHQPGSLPTAGAPLHRRRGPADVVIRRGQLTRDRSTTVPLAFFGETRCMLTEQVVGGEQSRRGVMDGVRGRAHVVERCDRVVERDDGGVFEVGGGGTQSLGCQ